MKETKYWLAEQVACGQDDQAKHPSLTGLDVEENIVQKLKSLALGVIEKVDDIAAFVTDLPAVDALEDKAVEILVRAAVRKAYAIFKLEQYYSAKSPE